MKISLFFPSFLILLSTVSIAHVYADTEIIPSPDPQCNQYFDAGSVYVGDFGKTLSDVVRNFGYNELDLYKDEQVPPFIEVAVPSVLVYTTPEFQYSSQLFTHCGGGWCVGASTGRQFSYLNGGDQFQWMETVDGKHLQVKSIDMSRVTDANRTIIRDKFFKIKYTTKGHFWSSASSSFVGDFNHVECQQIGVHFCGDGTKEAGKEVCDDGADNGKPGKCSTSCDGVTPLAPTCNQITASPTFGTTPLSTTLSCEGANLPTGSTYAISCGNGTNAVMSGNKGTCTYTNTSATDSVTYSPKCTINGSLTAPACQTNVVVNPLPTPPPCTPGSLSGTQVSPVTSTSSGLCLTGQAAVNFSSIISGQTTNYAWACKNGSITSATGGACVANYTSPIPPPEKPYLSIKKYAKSITESGDSQSSPVSVTPGESFNYYYVIENTGSADATGVVIKDTLPPYLTFSGIASVTNSVGVVVSSDWTFATGSQIFSGETVPRITFIATKKTPLPSHSGKYTFTIPVRLATTIPREYTMQNIAYICATNTDNNPKGPDGKDICGNIDPPPPPPPNQCTPQNNPQKDPACITISGFDLSIKKYIGNDDAQTSPGVQLDRNSANTYKLVVTNSGTQASTGLTTVQDILPTGVTFAGSGTWIDGSWSCTYSSTGTVVKCLSSQEVRSGSGYDPINIRFTVTASEGTTVLNMALVDNPRESNRCMADGSFPTVSGSGCTLDIKNSDPAYLTVNTPRCTTGCGGTGFVAKKCINDQPTCVNYGTESDCIAGGNLPSACLRGTEAGYAACKNTVLICSGGPPPPPPSCPVGSVCGSGGNICGDGVLQLGEECDAIGASWCGRSGQVDACKVKINTTIGQNPIVDMWIKIPALAGANRAGYTVIDAGKNLQVPLAGYRMVVGVNNNLFNLPDSVVFGMKTEFRAPIMIPAEKKFCLESRGSSLYTDQSACTDIETAVGPSGLNNINGKKYLLIGQGDYQVRQPDGTYHTFNVAGNINEITLFRGINQYSKLNETNVGPTLRDAFQSQLVGNDGKLSLFACAIDASSGNPDCIPTSRTSLAEIPVRVSGIIPSAIGAISNRSIEYFLKDSAGLPDSFLANTSVVTSTTRNNSVGSTISQSVQPIYIAGKTGNFSSSGVLDIERFAVNGNKNVLAINGNLTIENCPNNNTFLMNGVRTVIVTGNLIIKCNIVYDPSDATSSWAWITKGGDIQVYNGTSSTNPKVVTNIAGIYVAIADTTTGGHFTHIGNQTNSVLRVEGTLYGDAEDLLNSRTYARANGSYDVLTTGTILTYSNRALNNPPPLLSQYLSNYQVRRVAQ